jgi:hypothetical protein
LLHRSFHFVSDGMHDFALHDDCQLLLNYVSDFLGHSLLHLPDVRYLVDGLLNQREALVDGIVHASNGLQYRLKPRLLDIAAFVGALTWDSLLCQRSAVQFSLVDLGARSARAAQTCHPQRRAVVWLRQRARSGGH